LCSAASTERALKTPDAIHTKVSVLLLYGGDGHLIVLRRKGAELVTLKLWIDVDVDPDPDPRGPMPFSIRKTRVYDALVFMCLIITTLAYLFGSVLNIRRHLKPLEAKLSLLARSPRNDAC
jgi:hypothetical protein